MSLINLKNPVCLAPMAGVTLRPLREFFVRLGAAAVHTEMISCAGLYRNNLKTLNMLETSQQEQPVIVQLFAPEDKILCAGAEAALKYNKNFAAFGINMACPMPKVTRTGSGAALLNKPDMAFNMTKNLQALGLPVWVKIRRLESLDETLKFVEILANAGADNICIHGRTAAQRYEGLADKNFVKAAAKNFPGLIGESGDVKLKQDIIEYISFGCVNVMIARGAIANPWLVCEALDALGIKKFENLNAQERVKNIYELGKSAELEIGERQAVVLIKRMAAGLLKGMAGAAELRRRAGCSTNLNELLNIFAEIIN